MRFSFEQQPKLNQILISDVKIDISSRDEIPQILIGLQHIFENKPLRDKIFDILLEAIPEKVNINKGRRGMDLWTILVLGTVRNNFTYGNDHFGYYETIGDGAGAGPGFHGQSGGHTHMTNTRITDPEFLERYYPVLLRAFSYRKKSGGNGRFRGGDGLIRDIEFLAPLSISILSERRVYPPYGLNGGENGKKGKNLFIDKHGKEWNMGGKIERKVLPGDRIRILTPGGGGFGSIS